MGHGDEKLKQLKVGRSAEENSTYVEENFGSKGQPNFL